MVGLTEVKVVYVSWFTNSLGCIGLVSYMNSVGQLKHVYGIVKGLDEQKDVEYLIAWGTKVNLDSFIRHFTDAEYIYNTLKLSLKNETT